jgi:SAM-dependent methyltransferase
LGCGFGSGCLAEIDFSTYYGVDISEELLKEAHVLRDDPRAQLVSADLVVWYPSTDMCYNYVISLLALHYLPNPKELISRVRRPYVHFCFALPNPDYDKENGTVTDDRIVRLNFNNYPFVYFLYELEQVLDFLKPFSEVRIEYTPSLRFGRKPPYYVVSGVWG